MGFLNEIVPTSRFNILMTKNTHTHTICSDFETKTQNTERMNCENKK